MGILKFTVIASVSIFTFSIMYLLVGKYRQWKLLRRMFPHVDKKGELNKSEMKQFDAMYIEMEEGPINTLLGYMYLILNIPGAAFCNTMYRMDKAGVSGYVVSLASALVYAAAIPFIYFMAIARVSH